MQATTIHWQCDDEPLRTMVTAPLSGGLHLARLPALPGDARYLYLALTGADGQTIEVEIKVVSPPI